MTQQFFSNQTVSKVRGYFQWQALNQKQKFSSFQLPPRVNSYDKVHDLNQEKGILDITARNEKIKLLKLNKWKREAFPVFALNDYYQYERQLKEQNQIDFEFLVDEFQVSMKKDHERYKINIEEQFGVVKPEKKLNLTRIGRVLQKEQKISGLRMNAFKYRSIKANNSLQPDNSRSELIRRKNQLKIPTINKLLRNVNSDYDQTLREILQSGYKSERSRMEINFPNDRSKMMIKNMSEQLKEVEKEKFYIGEINYDEVNFRVNTRLKSNIMQKLKDLKKLD